MWLYIHTYINKIILLLVLAPYIVTRATLTTKIFQMAFYLSGSSRVVSKSFLCVRSIIEMPVNAFAHVKKLHDEYQYLNLVGHILQNGKLTGTHNELYIY